MPSSRTSSLFPRLLAGGLALVDPAAYKRAYEIKSKDDPKAWQALISLCKTLRDTAPENLETALVPIF